MKTYNINPLKCFNVYFEDDISYENKTLVIAIVYAIVYLNLLDGYIVDDFIHIQNFDIRIKNQNICIKCSSVDWFISYIIECDLSLYYFNDKKDVLFKFKNKSDCDTFKRKLKIIQLYA